VARWLGSPCDLLITAGPQGGLLLRYLHGRVASGRRYAGIPAAVERDPTGAGDTMLAGVLAGRMVGRPRGAVRGHALRLGAICSSLLVEREGLDAVPTISEVRERESRIGA
jgi:sugar/nucleoside kinase (ribokinase family)